MKARARKSAEERFWLKVQKTETCWNWAGAKDSDGYGNLRVRSSDDSRWTMTKAHRFAYRLTKQSDLEGVFLDHVCHNKACVNPGHLREVTNKQNMENRVGPNAGSASGVMGVHWHSHSQKWKAEVTHNGRNYYCGTYADKADAVRAVRAKRLKLFTHNDVDRAA